MEPTPEITTIGQTYQDAIARLQGGIEELHLQLLERVDGSFSVNEVEDLIILLRDMTGAAHTAITGYHQTCRDWEALVTEYRTNLKVAWEEQAKQRREIHQLQHQKGRLELVLILTGCLLTLLLIFIT